MDCCIICKKVGRVTRAQSFLCVIDLTVHNWHSFHLLRSLNTKWETQIIPTLFLLWSLCCFQSSQVLNFPMSCWIYCALVFISLCSCQDWIVLSMGLFRVKEVWEILQEIYSFQYLPRRISKQFSIGTLPFLLRSTLFHLPNIKARLKVFFFWTLQVKMAKGLNQRVWALYSAFHLV